MARRNNVREIFDPMRAYPDMLSVSDIRQLVNCSENTALSFMAKYGGVRLGEGKRAHWRIHKEVVRKVLNIPRVVEIS